MFGARHLRALCRDTGVPVEFAGVSTYSDTGEQVKGLLDQPMDIKLQGEGIGGAQIDHPELRLPFNAFQPMPTGGDVLTVDGTSYLVYPPTAEDDGSFLCYQLHEQESE